MRFCVYLIALPLLMNGCGDYDQITKQLPTFANLQTISQELQRRVEKNGSVTAEEAQALIDQYNGGRDSWGNAVVFHSRSEPGFSFILVSYGSDHALDVENIEEYYQMAEENIVGDLPRDIVFRDGRHVTIASEK